MSCESPNLSLESGENREALNVLVVEDERSIQELLGMVLTDEGFNVIQAYDAEQGMQVADELLESGKTIHAALLDNRMPKGTGMDVGRHIVEKELALESDRNIHLGRTLLIGISATEVMTAENLGVPDGEQRRVFNYPKPFKDVYELSDTIHEAVDQDIA